jgi:hypothetical protein
MLTLALGNPLAIHHIGDMLHQRLQGHLLHSDQHDFRIQRRRGVKFQVRLRRQVAQEGLERLSRFVVGDALLQRVVHAPAQSHD